MPHATPETLSGEHVATIELLEVTSSNIARVGYDPAIAVLLVEFQPPAHSPNARGGLYAYFSVPDEVAAGLIHADTEPGESVGRYFGEHIKPAQNYLCKALRAAPRKPKD